MLQQLKIIFFIACLLALGVTAPRAQPLCLGFTSFTAQKNGNCAVDLSWTYNQCSTGKYYVEYSPTGGNFKPVSVIDSTGTIGEQRYGHTDNYACPGDPNYSNAYYRIRLLTDNGNTYYSPVRTVAMGNSCSCTNNNVTRCSRISLSITGGQNPICSGSAQYTVTGVPTNAPIQWSVSDSSLAQITAGATSNTVTVTKTGGNGQTSLSVNLAYCAPSTARSLNIDIGIPPAGVMFFQNTFNGNGYFCSSHYGVNEFSMEPPLSNASYELRLLRWPSFSLVYSDPYIHSSSGTFLYTATPGWYILEARATNACGTGDWGGSEVEYVDCSLSGGGYED